MRIIKKNGLTCSASHQKAEVGEDVEFEMDAPNGEPALQEPAGLRVAVVVHGTEEETAEMFLVEELRVDPDERLGLPTAPRAGREDRRRRFSDSNPAFLVQAPVPRIPSAAAAAAAGGTCAGPISPAGRGRNF